MEELIIFQNRLLRQVSSKKRYLLNRIEWADRLIGIKGARGAGKTTLLLQHLKFKKPKEKEGIYITLDHLYFLENSLLEFVQSFVLNGGEYLYIDEVHKYPNWSRELKLIYDQHPQLKIIFTSSSLLEINRGESDLSRRAVVYQLKELSFREFIYFKLGIELKTISLSEILVNHVEIAEEISNQIKNPIKYFKEYLKFGAYPYFLESEETYVQKLDNTLSLIMEVDLNIVDGISYEESRKLKKLLVAIAQSAPFTPNISKISNRLDLQRGALINLIRLLNKAELIIELYPASKGIGAFTKPEKLYLNNTNLIYLLGKEHAETGTLRETFFANQMKHNHDIHLAKQGDFFIDKTYTFEIGGKNKTTKQIQGIENAFIVRDNMEVGGLNIIPLYLFGFLY
ncbi:MAG: AAA family ATPase [Flavobacteriaceae bacterium]|nr:AAA family ATPase [Flavobacteriaceae bacterium]